jgi:hypothetical protein
VQLLIGILGGLMGTVVGGVLTWFATRWKLRLELEHNYDKELRTERIAAYKQLWQITRALPRYHWPTKPTRSDLRDLIEICHSWYFEVGGLFFSQETKDTYFTMMDTLDRVAGRQAGNKAEVDDDVLRELFIVGERLRLQLAADVGTGLRPQVSSSQLRAAKDPTN